VATLVTFETSIIVPAHNEEGFLPGVLTTIRQHGPSGCEVIVVDNGSIDNTAAVVAAHGAKLVRLETKTYPAQARNEGVSQARGALLVFLDADVELTPEWQREWVARKDSLQSRPLQVTGDQYHISRRPGWIELGWFAPLRARKPQYINGGNLITTRALFDAIGGFDNRLETGEDVDFCNRATAAGAELVIGTGFKVFHEGYPKTLARFVKRERWHGTGDFRTVGSMLRSKVALSTLVFVLLHLCLLGAVLGALAVGSGYFVAALAAASVLVLCLASATQKFRSSGFAAVLRAWPVMYWYYVGRSLSAWDALLRLLSGGSSGARHR
jgi:GT2 family glycosyltransferase